ncbi:PREDICTED: phospholipase A-2-activating protein-like [Papilio xuthus]|uniref:Phospholipase A-2-activating protein-like n=1 Tax=Papilio xuthus TaxID=66420 RepID=A0AAJ6ZRY9_PAPXU|nr:PREDICTED: phospholipase A-2-activating protein-like [Papilio xuthus]
MAIPDYKLSTVLCGHSLDVRCVAITKESCILSGSRDRTAKLWHPEGVKDFVNVVTYKGHNNFVSCVCWFSPCEAFPDGLVITGSNDNTIIGYNLQDGTILLTLKGHENAVCSIATSRDSGILLSSSWDNTAKVWNINNIHSEPLTLKGHQAAVWAIVELGNGTYATASADKTIKLWKKDGSGISTLTGHTDCVRDLAVATAEVFLSCSNDATVRLWTNKGERLNTYYGHSNYIYSICINPGVPNSFTTCGEDGTVRLWSNGDCVREIHLPVQSVWSVTCLDNGDIVTGSSDGVIRVFTKDPARYADEATIKTFEEEVEKMQFAAKQEIGGYKLSDIPGPEVLLEAGKTDGQTKLVRRGTNVKCYSWSAAECTWNEVGDVMGAQPPTEGKTMYQGKEYDYVFSVDIKDGAPPIKLPYNKTEDPWVAAQAFIHKNDLPQVYLEQVANFIITNAKLNALPTPSNGYADPFTGESRYVPGTGPATRAVTAMDPFTGAGAYTTAAASNTSVTTATDKRYIPHDAYIRFDQANLKAIYDKLKEFNGKAGDGNNSFTDEQLENIVKLGEMNGSFNPDTISLLKKMLEWPKEILFPVLDVTRLAIRRKEINSQIFDTTYGPNFVKYLLSLLNPDNLAANQMLAMRVLVNAFSDLAGEMLVLAARETLIHCIICLTHLNNNAQIAAASLLLNLSVALAQQPDIAELTDCIVHLLSRLTDNEAYFRGLVALGTLLAESPQKLPIQTKIVSNTQLHNRLKQDCNTTTSDANLKKISICSQEIIRLL